MSIEVWTAFVATSIVVLMIPGPTILTVVSYALVHGRPAYAPLIAAIVLGDSTAIAVSLLGLGALLQTSAYWFTVIKIIGGLYLLYLGLRFLVANRANSAGVMRPVIRSRRQLFGNMYLVAVLNPKGVVFYVAFFPQFLSPAANAGAQLSLLAATFIVLGLLNSTMYVLFAASSRGVLTTTRAQRGLRVIGGTLLSAAGAYALLGR